MKRVKSQTKSFILNRESIDEASEWVAETLSEADFNRKDILKFRLSVEDVMLKWLEEIGEGTECIVKCGTRLRRSYLSLSAAGSKSNPSEFDSYDEIGNGSSLLSLMGLAIEYHYRDGINEVSMLLVSEPSAKKPWMLISLVVSVLLGIIITGFLPEAGNVLYEQAVTPLFNTMMNLLSALAGPMIFLAVCSGIYGVGDVVLFGKIGKKLIKRFVGMTFVFLAGTLVLCLQFVDVTFNMNSMNMSVFSRIYQMILDIIPPDIVSPFQTGNALQIIFMACIFGVTVLILEKSVPSLKNVLNELHVVIQFIMVGISKLMPLLIGISILNLFLSGTIKNIGLMGKQIIICIGIGVIGMFLYGFWISRKYKISVFYFFKKVMPSFLIALSTASSTAAFSKNVDICRNELGIDGQIVNFGIPLGQVIYMPLGAVEFLVAAMCIGSGYSVDITPAWLVIAVFVSGILSIAVPPIAGGALSCFTILFTQLGIPMQGIALAIGLDMIIDYVVTACDIFCVQSELLLVASSMDMVDETVLRR